MYTFFSYPVIAVGLAGGEPALFLPAYGLFSVGTMWIFILTYKYFLHYITANIIMDAFLCFIGLSLLTRLGIATFKIGFWLYFLIVFTISFIIYSYQK
ncbi:hypothetical protein [Bacillus sp. V2I10]|uniref:hypothetical protein n=1 Tax=Bacillus sp. V2I10 TaxID=3042276 RepID=UPI00278045BA|nr:hypothetical protein [Bacillus sp. V2I10]MDQ0858780.1 glucan phosphoethanolaminetransferase (alkaline phosphatase superfamily) [Bacillus sp. V2I10]